MRFLLFVIAPLLAADAGAVVIVLKDGTRVEGTIEGDMDGVKLVKTRYGSLTIDGKDISSIGEEIGARDPLNVGLSTAPAPAPEAVAASTGTAEIAVSTEPLPAPLDLPPAPAAGPALIFRTVTFSTSSFLRVYSEGGIVIATETYDSRGELQTLEGAIKDGTYREYYDSGNLKTEKTLVSGKTDGTLKAYYPGGTVQSEAYYLQGRLAGAVRIYGESARLLFEQNFRDGVPNGWFREFDDAGAVKSEVFYTDGKAAEKPKPAEKPAAAKKTPATAEEAENILSAKSLLLARGERISFFVNNKYIARMQLDKDFNIISREGKIPDGEVQVYGKTGALEKELTFRKNELVLLKAINFSGGTAGEYIYKDGKAAKK